MGDTEQLLGAGLNTLSVLLPHNDKSFAFIVKYSFRSTQLSANFGGLISLSKPLAEARCYEGLRVTLDYFPSVDFNSHISFSSHETSLLKRSCVPRSLSFSARVLASFAVLSSEEKSVTIFSYT